MSWGGAFGRENFRAERSLKAFMAHSFCNRQDSVKQSAQAVSVESIVVAGNAA